EIEILRGRIVERADVRLARTDRAELRVKRVQVGHVADYETLAVCVETPVPLSLVDIGHTGGGGELTEGLGGCRVDLRVHGHVVRRADAHATRSGPAAFRLIAAEYVILGPTIGAVRTIAPFNAQPVGGAITTYERTENAL